MATQIVEVTGDERKLLQALDKMIAKELAAERALGAMGDAGAAAGVDIEAALGRVARANEKDVAKLIKDLGKIGPEGKAAAEIIESQLRGAEASAALGMDEILEKLAKLKPEVGISAEAIRLELSAASEAAQKEFDDMVNKLKEIGPVGEQVANELRTQMETAGESSESSVEEIIEKIRKINPEAAAAAASIHRNIDKASKDSETSWGTFAKSAIKNILAIAAAYVGVSEGIQVVNDFLRTQNELYAEALSKQQELAKSQQETFKNLAGLSEAARIGLIEAAPGIARDTGFSNIGAIVEATGAAVSAGADRQSAESAVSAAALFTINTPDAIQELTAAAIDLRRATGSSDARANLGFLNLAGTQARVVDPLALAETIAPALVSAAASVPEQNKIEASRQAASLFATLSKSAADKTGKSSGTATTQFAGELNKFFGDLEQQRVDARSKVELIDRKIEKGKDTEADRVKRENLLSFLDEAATLQDPKTLFGRIETLQTLPAVKEQFFSKEFGEVRFKQAFKDVADSTSAIASEMKDSFNVIQISTEAFDDQVRQITGATAPLRIAALGSRFTAASEAGRAEDPLGALRGLVRGQAEQQLRETRGTGFGGFLESFQETGVRDGFLLSANLIGDSVASEAVDAIDRTIKRQAFLSLGGVSPEEQPKIEQAAAALDVFREAALEAARLDPSSIPEAVQQLREKRSLASDPRLLRGDGSLEQVGRRDYFEQLMEELRDIAKAAAEANERTASAAEATASNTSTAPEPINYGNVQRGR